jgi:hypothetical protein
MVKKISEAALKKAILAVEAERSKHTGAFRPDRAQRATLQKSRRGLDKIVSGFLREAGLDIEKLQALAEQRGVELERMVAKHKADALRGASRQKDTLQSSIVQQSKALRDLAVRGVIFFPSYVLDKPFIIWTSPLQEISDSAVVPGGSWAKFKFAASKTPGANVQRLSFWFYWVNDFRDYALINAATYMSATGYLKAHAPWEFGESSGSIEAWAGLGLSPVGPDNLQDALYAMEVLGSVQAYGSFLGGGHTDGTSISSGVSLNQTMFPVAPATVVLFEVALILRYIVSGDGDIEADFESGDFQITCPDVVVSLLNSPPR